MGGCHSMEGRQADDMYTRSQNHILLKAQDYDLSLLPSFPLLQSRQIYLPIFGL